MNVKTNSSRLNFKDLERKAEGSRAEMTLMETGRSRVQEDGIPLGGSQGDGVTPNRRYVGYAWNPNCPFNCLPP